MATGDIYRMKIIWRHDEGLPAIINDFYFRQENALIFDTPGEDLWQSFGVAALPAYQSMVTDRLAIFQVIFGRAPDFVTEEVIDVPGIVGTATGDPLSPILCGLLARYTNLLTRRGRGRLYLPPTNEALQENGRPGSTYRAALIAFGAEMLNMATILNPATAHWTPMLWSETDQTARVVTSFVGRGHWGFQSDRRGAY